MPPAGDVQPPGLDVVWAKSMPMVPPPTEWLPLWQHLDDTLGVAAWLWDTWVPPASRRLIGAAFPGGEGDARKALMWFAGTHDVGKVSLPFAGQVDCLADRMRRRGLRGSSTTKPSELRHEVVSAWALQQWLTTRGWRVAQTRQFTCVLAGHHGYFDKAPRYPGSAGGDDSWMLVRNYLLDRAAEGSGVADRLDEWRSIKLPQAVQMQLAALVVMADWMASSDRFSLQSLDHVEPCPPRVTPGDRLRRGIDQIDLGGTWHAQQVPSDPVAAYKSRFPTIDQPRPLQRAVAEAARTMDAPGLMIIEGPMGVGKTEAALVAAETLAARSGCQGVFFALPTQATTDAMFTRVHTWLDHVAEDQSDGALSLALVHGKAVLNDEFQDLRWHTNMPVYEGSRGAGVGVAAWMQGRKRAALSSFVVGTIDQVLFAALNAKHVMLRQLSLSGKVVILDEVHAADSYMLVFLERALQWMGASSVPVILMSATLPGARRRSLYDAYESGRQRLHGESIADASSLLGDIGYPVITVSGADGPQVRQVEATNEETPVLFEQIDDAADAIADRLEDLLSDGGCAVVIRNTVGRVQETARVLIERFGDDAVTVAHARFLAVDRARIDRELLRRFGPPDGSRKRPKRHIVVASQVVEQSLDVDFDVMVSDLAPIDLLMQRVGRLHRHQRGEGQSERPESLRTATCFVSGVDWNASPPKPESTSKTIYGGYPLLAALAVLLGHPMHEPVTLPHQIAPLVQAGYSDDLQPPEGWEVNWVMSRAENLRRRNEQSARAKDFCLAPVQKDGKSLFLLSRGALPNDESPTGQAAVRDNADDSVEVVVVQFIDGSHVVPTWVPCDDPRLPLPDQPLDWRQAAVLATCTLRLPYKVCNPGSVDRVIKELETRRFEGWQQSPLLTGQLALVLDEDRRGSLLDFDLQYDERLGLLAEKATQ